MRRWLASLGAAAILAVVPFVPAHADPLNGYTIDQWKAYISYEINTGIATGNWQMIMDGLNLYMYLYVACETGEIGPTEQCWN